MDTLNAHKNVLSEEEADMLRVLIENGQQHLFASWKVGEHDDKKRKMLQQALEIHRVYPLQLYVSNAKRLLKQSCNNENPYKDYDVRPVDDAYIIDTTYPAQANRSSSSNSTTPSSTDSSQSVGPRRLRIEAMEKVGIEHVHECAFVLLAGGLGERLGYNGIKLEIPTEIVSGICFLSLYAQFIKSYEKRSHAQLTASRSTPLSTCQATEGKEVKLPLAIMTSDDTHERTEKLLRSNDYFGLNPSQVHLIKQVKVPAMLCNEARFAVEDDDPFIIQTKPHGHGDVHTLLHSSGLAKTWLEEGRKYVFFFQDTNALAFRAFLSLLGTAVTHRLVMTTLAIPRSPEDAIGAICKLTRRTPSSTSSSSSPEVDELPQTMTINVEYNQLQALLPKEQTYKCVERRGYARRSSPTDPNTTSDSDMTARVSTTNETANAQGDLSDDCVVREYSIFAGNSNAFVVDLNVYVPILQQTSGQISEFVNPKYADASKTVFKKPTRLECMMQDLPKLFRPEHAVGVAMTELWTAFNPVKNSIKDALDKQKNNIACECAATAEFAMYEWGRRVLAELGVNFVEGNQPPSPLTPKDLSSSSSNSVSLSIPCSPGLQTFPSQSSPYLTLQGIRVPSGPLIVLDPSFGVTREEIAAKIPNPSQIYISETSSLVLSGSSLVLESLRLDGHLHISAPSSLSPRTKCIVRDLNISNPGIRFLETDSKDEAIRIRGYVVDGDSSTWQSSYVIPASDTPNTDLILSDATKSKYQTTLVSPYATTSTTRSSL